MDYFKKLYKNITKNGVRQDENGEWTVISSSVNRKKMQDSNWIPPKILITPFDLENKFSEQNGKCYWSGTDLDMSLLNTDGENHIPMHPLAPSVDKINPSGDYSYENIVICIRMLNLGRSTSNFKDFHNLFSKLIYEMIVENKMQPYMRSYIEKMVQQKQLQENLNKSQMPEITWDDIFFTNPKLKEVLQEIQV